MIDQIFISRGYENLQLTLVHILPPITMISAASDTSRFPGNLLHKLFSGNQPLLNQQLRQCVSLRQTETKKFFQGDRSFIWFCHCASSVAVGAALASGPPHGSVREGLPHTALTSGYCNGQPLVGIRLAVCATTPVTRIPGSGSGASALVVRSPWSTSFPLRTPPPNAYASALFARFVGTMRPSDSPQTCMSTLRLFAFFDRPTPSCVGVCGASRFSRMEFPHMPRVS